MSSPANVKRAITRFENAVRLHTMMGAHHPDDWEYIEGNYEKSRAALLNAIFGKPKPRPKKPREYVPHCASKEQLQHHRNYMKMLRTKPA